MNEKTVTIPDMSCGHCLAAVKREAEEIQGVKSVTGNIDSKQVNFEWEEPATWEQIAEALKDAGYPPQ